MRLCQTGPRNDGEPMRIAEIADDNEIAGEVGDWTPSGQPNAKREAKLLSRQHKPRYLRSQRWRFAKRATKKVDRTHPGLGLPSERLRRCIRDRD